MGLAREKRCEVQKWKVGKVTFRKQPGAGSQDSGTIFPRGPGIIKGNEEGVGHGIRVSGW